MHNFRVSVRKPDLTTTRSALQTVVAATLFLVLHAGCPRITEGQGVSLPPEMSMASDPEAARHAMIAIVEKLSGSIVGASSQTAETPWKLDFPRAAGVPWEKYEDNILRVVRGRKWIERDSVMRNVHVSEMRMHGDTMVVRFTVGSQSKCQGEWRRGASAYEFRARILDGTYIRSETKWVSTSDSIQCRTGN